MNEMIASGKIVVKIYGGRESIYVSDEGDDQDSESEESEFVSPNKISPIKLSDILDLDTLEPITVHCCAFHRHRQKLFQFHLTGHTTFLIRSIKEPRTYGRKSLN